MKTNSTVSRNKLQYLNCFEEREEDYEVKKLESPLKNSPTDRDSCFDVFARGCLSRIRSMILKTYFSISIDHHRLPCRFRFDNFNNHDQCDLFSGLKVAKPFRAAGGRASFSANIHLPPSIQRVPIILCRFSSSLIIIIFSELNYTK